MNPPSETLFFDDFSTGALDRSNWNVRVTGKVVNDELQAYIDSNETISILGESPGADGPVLELRPRYRPGFVTDDGQTFDFVSGRIDTRDRFSFRHGSASARMRLPTGEGIWPAFWAMGYGRWPQTGEIDIMEYVGEADWVSNAVHGPGYSGEGGLVNKLFFSDETAATDWHVYTVNRRPNVMTFEVDGELVYRVTRPMTEFFGTWQFEDEKFLILNCALGGTYPFKTNGIRSPYYGLPQQTVTRIERNEAAVLVDWVRVVRLPEHAEERQADRG
jgi:hypothetical protein